jgi:hypothetical protein
MALSILIGTVGIFTLSPPFTIGKVNYTITKLNLIKPLLNSGVDVYNAYYAPAGITLTKFNEDSSNGHAIVTLESDDGPTINVPSGYIALAPIEPAVLYSHVILSVDLGDLPDEINLSQMKDDIKSITDGAIGSDTLVNLHTLPASKVYSHEDYVASEMERNAKITEYVSFYTSKVSADEELAIAKTTINKYSKIIISLKEQLKVAQST